MFKFAHLADSQVCFLDVLNDFEQVKFAFPYKGVKRKNVCLQ